MPVSHWAIQRRVRGVSGMSHGCTNTGTSLAGAVLEERDDARVVEIAVADVVADLDAAVPGRDGPVELAAGGVGVLQAAPGRTGRAAAAPAPRSPARGR
jgi:hypothetical protein